MTEVINIAAYKFFPLADLQALRERLRAQCKLWKLRGTILLSPEGINLFVAGGRAEIDLLLLELRAIPGLEGFEPKVSVSERQPFNRMLVRIKREIIALRRSRHHAQVCRTSPKVAPLELKRWLDEGRPIALLLPDTRNALRSPNLAHLQGARVIGDRSLSPFSCRRPRFARQR